MSKYRTPPCVDCGAEGISRGSGHLTRCDPCFRAYKPTLPRRTLCKGCGRKHRGGKGKLCKWCKSDREYERSTADDKQAARQAVIAEAIARSIPGEAIKRHRIDRLGENSLMTVADALGWDYKRYTDDVEFELWVAPELAAAIGCTIEALAAGDRPQPPKRKEGTMSDQRNGSKSPIAQRADEILHAGDATRQAEAVTQAEQEAADASAEDEPERERLREVAADALALKLDADAVLDAAIAAVIDAANAQTPLRQAAQRAHRAAVVAGCKDVEYVRYIAAEDDDARRAGYRNGTYNATGALVELSVGREVYTPPAESQPPARTLMQSMQARGRVQMLADTPDQLVSTQPEAQPEA